MGWPQTVHVSAVLHAVASCALLAQLVDDEVMGVNDGGPQNLAAALNGK